MRVLFVFADPRPAAPALQLNAMSATTDPVADENKRPSDKSKKSKGQAKKPSSGSSASASPALMLPPKMDLAAAAPSGTAPSSAAGGSGNQRAPPAAKAPSTEVTNAATDTGAPVAMQVRSDALETAQELSGEFFAVIGGELREATVADLESVVQDCAYVQRHVDEVLDRASEYSMIDIRAAAHV